MKLSVATVEPNGQHAAPFRATEPGGSRPAGSGSRFTYPSGSQILPGYTIKRGVGHGGFGEVYYALSDAGKEVALKLIRRNLDIELRGIRHCLNLKHPNLLAIYDIREDEQGDQWVVMEYVNGENLEEVISRYPQGMPRDEALAWFFGIAAGVACLHDHGIVHRDLKPGNIFSDEGIVKLGDYGLSKFISCSRRSGQTESVGTVHYMAPEIANGRYGKEIDVYALGVILFEMLTGRVPFEGESVGEVLMKHLTQPADVSPLEEPYRSVVAKALEKDPAKRFSTVGEMLAALPRPMQPQVHVGPLPSSAGPQVASAGLGGAGTAIPVAEAVEEEPIFRAARHGARKAFQAWNESRINTPAKIIILVAVLFALITTMHGWMPFAFMAVILYGVYWVARSIVLASNKSSRPSMHAQPGSPFGPNVPPRPMAQPAAQPVPPRGARPTHFGQRRREAPIDALVLKSPRERTAELLGSLLGSALVAITMSIVMVILNGYRGAEPRVEQAAWLLLVSLVGSWAVIVPSKLWEGSPGDPMLRRFVLMVVGFGVGMFAFLVAGTLSVPLVPQMNAPGLHVRLPSTFYAGDGRPMLMAFLAVFGTMFLVLRWWRLADPLRSTRMSLWAMGVTVLFAWLVGSLWMFPMPWLLMVACTMSVAIQLASPWVHPRVRRARAAQRREV